MKERQKMGELTYYIHMVIKRLGALVSSLFWTIIYVSYSQSNQNFQDSFWLCKILSFNSGVLITIHHTENLHDDVLESEIL